MPIPIAVTKYPTPSNICPIATKRRRKRPILSKDFVAKMQKETMALYKEEKVLLSEYYK